jgi:hypothetical protein
LYGWQTQRKRTAERVDGLIAVSAFGRQLCI